MPAARWIGLAGSLLGLVGVALAAIGAHAVPGMDEPATYRSWQSASVLHLVHAGLLLILAGMASRNSSHWITSAAVLTVIGIFLFSGSIYLRVILGFASTAGLAPFGGVCLMLAWLCCGLGVLRNRA